MVRESHMIGGLFSWLAFASIALAANYCPDRVVGGVPYCQKTSNIVYKQVASSGGTYRDVKLMGSGGDCTCQMNKETYSGALAPLDDQMSIHFRGPLRLHKFAVYYPDNIAPKGKRPAFHRHAHGHAHAHKRRGSVESVGGNLKRSAYYDAAAGKAKGLTFMNFHGGDGSGVWDTCFGNSISYASASCEGGSDKPQILEDKLIPSNKEFIIFTDEECDDSCGYYRPGIPAHKGFSGRDKVFIFEFSMPSDAGDGGLNSDMPSIWALNAKIPRTQQYGKCSCWKTGCGEFDFFEVLEGAKGKVKSHFHADPEKSAGGGSPDYFARPYDKPVKAAVIFDSKGEVHVKVLDDTIEFDKDIDGEKLRQCGGEPSVYEVPN